MKVFAETSITFVIVEAYYLAGLSAQVVWARAFFDSQREVHGSNEMGIRT
jgi:hypothetical protein